MEDHRAGWLVGWLVGWPTDWVSGQQAGWKVAWLPSYPAVWLTISFHFQLKLNSKSVRICSWVIETRQCSFIFNWNVIQNLQESALGFLRQSSFHFQLELDNKLIRFCSGLLQTNMTAFSNILELGMHHILFCLESFTRHAVSKYTCKSLR